MDLLWISCGLHLSSGDGRGCSHLVTEALLFLHDAQGVENGDEVGGALGEVGGAGDRGHVDVHGVRVLKDWETAGPKGRKVLFSQICISLAQNVPQQR